MQTVKVGAQIAGTQKGGTSALFEFLRCHPQIATPRGLKEVHFFDNDSLFSAGTEKYQQYESLFPTDAQTRIALEATPIYMYWRPAPARIAAYNPDTKLILILRDPVDRAISHWEMEFSRGTEIEIFEVALQRELEGREGSQDRVRSYVERGLYGAQIRRLLDFFPLQQILILQRDDLLLNHDQTLFRIYEFLGVERPQFLPSPKIVHPVPKSPALPAVAPEIRSALRSVFAEDLADLQALTGVKFGFSALPKSVSAMDQQHR